MSLVFRIALVSLLVTAGAGCELQDGNTTTFDADVRVPARIAFPATFVDLLATTTLDLVNDGTADAAVEVVVVTPPFFLREPLRTAQVPALGEVTLQLAVRPAAVGQLDGTLELLVDGEPFSVSLSVDGIARPLCDDFNPCTDDRFDSELFACVSTPREGSCDDQSACTLNDVCLSGRCVGDPVACDDDVTCTFDTCVPAVGCVFTPENSRCDDGDPCRDDVCDATLGCLSEISEDFTPCGLAVECGSAQVCRDGACIALAIPDGAPCGGLGFCPSAGTCAGGACQSQGASTLFHDFAGRRNFFPLADVTYGENFTPLAERLAIAGDYMWGVSTDEVMTASVVPYGIELVSRAPTNVVNLHSNGNDGVVGLDENGTLMSATTDSAGVASAFRRLPTPVGTVTAIFPLPDGRVRVCTEESDQLFAADGPLEGTWLVSDMCRHVGKTLVFARDRFWVVREAYVGVELVLFDADGAQVAVESLERTTVPQSSASLDDEAVFAWRNIRFDDPLPTTILARTRDGEIEVVGASPPGLENDILGAADRRLFWMNDDRRPFTLRVSPTGEFSQSVGLGLARVQNLNVVGSTSTKIVLRVRLEADEIVFWNFERSEADTLGALLPDAYALTMNGFEVDSAEKVTIFAEEGTRDTDLVSLTATPAPGNLLPPPRAARPTVYFLEFEHVEAINPVRSQNGPPLFDLVQSAPALGQPNLVTTVPFVTPPGSGALAFQDHYTLVNGEAVVSVVRALSYDPQTREVSAVVLRSPAFHNNHDDAFTPIVGFPALPASPREGTSLHPHPFHFATIAVTENVALVRIESEVTTFARFDSPNATAPQYDHTEAQFDLQSWVVLFSGSVPADSTVTQGAAPLLVTSQDLVNFQYTTLDRIPPLPGKFQPTARLLGMADGLVYVGRLDDTNGPLSPSIDVYEFGAAGLDLVEVIPLVDEAIQMAILADGRRMVGDRMGFSFFLPQCAP